MAICISSLRNVHSDPLFLKMDIFCLWRVLRILHIFWIQASLSDIWLADICHFTFLILSFEAWKSFKISNDVQSVFLFFSFIAYASDVIFKKPLPSLRLQALAQNSPTTGLVLGHGLLENQAQSRRWAALCSSLHSCITAWIFCPIALITT